MDALDTIAAIATPHVRVAIVYQVQQRFDSGPLHLPPAGPLKGSPTTIHHDSIRKRYLLMRFWFLSFVLALLTGEDSVEITPWWPDRCPKCSGGGAGCGSAPAEPGVYA